MHRRCAAEIYTNKECIIKKQAAMALLFCVDGIVRLSTKFARKEIYDVDKSISEIVP